MSPLESPSAPLPKSSSLPMVHRQSHRRCQPAMHLPTSSLPPAIDMLFPPGVTASFADQRCPTAYRRPHLVLPQLQLSTSACFSLWAFSSIFHQCCLPLLVSQLKPSLKIAKACLMHIVVCAQCYCPLLGLCSHLLCSLGSQCSLLCSLIASSCCLWSASFTIF